METPAFKSAYFTGFIKAYNPIFKNDQEYKIWFMGGK